MAARPTWRCTRGCSSAGWSMPTASSHGSPALLRAMMEAACTEAEAMAAADLAARLMSTWDSEQVDLAEAERGLEIEYRYIVTRPKVDLCLAQLQQLTRCKVCEDDGEWCKVAGSRPEIEFFICLYYIIAQAM